MLTSHPDWSDLWQLTTRWISTPIAGILLPPNEQATLGTAIFEDFLDHFPSLPGREESLSYLQQRARDVSLAHTAKMRLSQQNPALWRDPEWKPGGEGLHPSHLNASSSSVQTAAWKILVRDMKCVALPIIRRQGVSEADAEGIYFKLLADLDQGRTSSSKRALDEVVVYEQLPRLIAVMARNQAVDYMRAQTRQKNTPNFSGAQDSLDENETLGHSLADPQATRWLDDPFSTLTFDQIYRGCKDVLSRVQWRIVTGLFVEEQTVLDLCGDDGLVRELELSASASVSTRRRRLGDQLQGALDGLAGCLKSRDLWTTSP
jgi:hypothetical protein